MFANIFSREQCNEVCKLVLAGRIIRLCLYKATVSAQGLPEQHFTVMMIVLLSDTVCVMFTTKCFTESEIKAVEESTWRDLVV